MSVSTWSVGVCFVYKLGSMVEHISPDKTEPLELCEEIAQG